MKLTNNIYDDLKHFHFTDAGLSQQKLIAFQQNLRYNNSLKGAVYHPFALKMLMGMHRPKKILVLGAENKISAYSVKDVAAQYIGLVKPKLYIMACDRYLSNMRKDDTLPDYVFFGSPFKKGYTKEVAKEVFSILNDNPQIIIFASEMANLHEVGLHLLKNKIFLLQDVVIRMKNESDKLGLEFQGGHNQSLAFSQYITTMNCAIGYALQFLKANEVFVYKCPYMSSKVTHRIDGVSWIKVETKELSVPLYTDVSYIMGAKHLMRLCERYEDKLVWLDKDEDFHNTMPSLI